MLVDSALLMWLKTFCDSKGIDIETNIAPEAPTEEPENNELLAEFL
jgi:hypothetical protein